MNLDKEKVKSFLPHREPFLFVDSVESIKFLDENKNNGKVENLSILRASSSVEPVNRAGNTSKRVG